MKRISTIPGLFALICFVTFVPWGCSDDDPAGGGGPVDTTPPGVTSVTATDASHVEVVFSEAVEPNSAEDPDNYLFIEGTPVPALNADAAPSSPGDTAWVATAVLAGDGRTVSTTLWSPMNDAPYDFYITGVKDLNGNAITSAESGGFDGTQDPDITAPTVVSHTPASGATGVPIGQTVVIVFSEAMNYSSVVGAFTWTGPGGQVPFDVDEYESNIFALQPQTLLQQNTQYTIAVSSSAMDLAGNHLVQTSWNFRTTAVADNTPPTLVSTTPADGATNVPVTTNLRLQFSEAIDRYGLEYIVITPEIGDGVDSWSPDGSTITFDPDVDLADNTQYVMVIGQGSITDLAGNPMEESIIIRFTTAASLESGRISGQLAGDPGTAAANPADAVVVISSIFIFDYQGEGPPPIEGAAIAGTGGVYSVTNLIDGTFWPFAMKETNDDGYLEFESGDAIGAYGLDIASGDYTPTSVTISGGSQVGDVDFPLIDPSAISGQVSYAGSMYTDWWIYDRYVGLFDQDPSGGGVDPIGGIGPDPLGSNQDYIMHQFEVGFLPGTYYVGAFLDVNWNGEYDPSVDPAGYYMNGTSIGTVTLTNGADAFDVDIALFDPATLGAAPAGWRIPPRDEAAEARAERWRRVAEFLQQAVKPVR
jgi:hypothetical protein